MFSTAGDAYAAAFARDGSAVDEAIAVQSALLSEPWPEGAAVQVRMGLHAGEAQERGGDYFGLALNPCGPADVGSQWQPGPGLAGDWGGVGAVRSASLA